MVFTEQPQEPESEIQFITGIDKVRHADGSKTINGYHVLERLGDGMYARVKLCRSVSSDKLFAIKIFRKGFLARKKEYFRNGDRLVPRTALDKVYQEVELMKRMRHPSLVQLHAVVDEPKDPQGKLYLIIEHAALGHIMDWDSSREVFFVPATKGLVGEQLSRGYIHGLLRGLQYMHSNLVAHRDIKPPNLLLSESGCVKIGDFSASTAMPEDWQLNSTDGTMAFFSPEMCRQPYNGHDGRRADVWAAGLSLWAFLFGSSPFFSSDAVLLFEKIAEAKPAVPASPAVSSECLACLLKMLASDPDNRPLCEELLSEDPWCRGGGGAE